MYSTSYLASYCDSDSKVVAALIKPSRKLLCIVELDVEAVFLWRSMNSTELSGDAGLVLVIGPWQGGEGLIPWREEC